MKKISIAALLLAVHVLHGQSVRSPLSVRYTGMGTCSKNFTDVFSGSTNQAALAEVKAAGAGVYGERRFLLKDISNYTAVITCPSKLGGFGIAINYFGGEYFNTSQLGLGYGKKLGDKIDIGVQFNYNAIRLLGYGGSSTINFEAGVLFHLTDKIHIGVHVYNPAGGKFGKMSNEKLASVYTTSLGYEVSNKFFLTAAISKEEEQPVNITAGIQYNFADHFFTRLGVVAATGNYFFGIGLQWKVCRIDVINTWQAQLGFTPGIMFIFNFHEDKQPVENEN